MRQAGEELGVSLAVSLHAPNDELRNRLVPVNRNIGIAPILAAADRYFEHTGRLEDIPADTVQVSGLPDAPGGAAITRVDVIIRVDA